MFGDYMCGCRIAQKIISATKKTGRGHGRVLFLILCLPIVWI